MNNVVKYGVGLLALGVTVYVVGVAWRRSQKKNGSMAGFAGIDGVRGNIPKTRSQCLCGGIRRDCPCPQQAS